MAETAVENSIYQVRIKGRIELQEYNNVIHFRATQTGEDIVEELLIVAYLCFVQSLVGASGSAFTITGAEVKRVSPTVGPVWLHSPGTGDTTQGAAEGDTLPSFVSVRTDIRCERGGRSGRGAISVAGIPDAATTGSQILPTSPYWTALLAWVECMRTHFLKGHGFSTKPFVIGVVSRKTPFAKKPPFTNDQISDAVSLQPHANVGSQNSRKVGHGS